MPELSSPEPRGQHVAEQLGDLVGLVRRLPADGRLEHQASAGRDHGTGVTPGVPRAELADPELASDVQRLMEACKRMEEAQNKVEQLYARWAELSEKKE